MRGTTEYSRVIAQSASNIQPTYGRNVSNPLQDGVSLIDCLDDNKVAKYTLCDTLYISNLVLYPHAPSPSCDLRVHTSWRGLTAILHCFWLRAVVISRDSLAEPDLRVRRKCS